MALKRQHKALSMYSMASMTDVIFLLLIFFLVTSTLVSPSAMEVNLPQSGQQTTLKPNTRIYIDKDMNMYATQGDSIKEGELMPLAPEQLEPFMQSIQQTDPKQFVALYADEEVPYGKIVDILDKGSKAGLKIVLATKPTNGDEPAATTAGNAAAVAGQQQATASQPATATSTQ